MFLEAAVSGIEAAGGPVGGCVSGRPAGSLAAVACDPRLVTRGSTPLLERGNAAPRTRSKASKGKASSASGGVLEEKPLGCLCTYTKHERQEHKQCPVHGKVRVKS